MAYQDDADREAAELLPCSFRETDCPGNDPYKHFDCPHPYRPAVAAKLRAKELYGSQGWDRWHKALDRIAVLEAERDILLAALEKIDLRFSRHDAGYIARSALAQRPKP